MNIAMLRYNTMELPHNREKLDIVNNGESTKVSIEGELFGAAAPQLAKRLEEMYKKRSVGALCMPEIGACPALISKLELSLGTAPGVIQYSVTFEALVFNDTSSGELLFRVECDDTLWGLSEKLNCTVDELVLANAGTVKGICVNTGDKIIIPGKPSEVSE